MNKQEKAISDKLSSFYPVKSMEGESIENINMNKRTVTGVLNTSYYIDHDLDMILPGAVRQSLNDNGPKSEANVKIKYQIDHSLKADDTIGRFDILEERERNGVFDLYFEGYLPPIVSDKHLIKYQSGLYEQHSIGFQYVNLTLAEKDSDIVEYRENWDKYYPLAMNPEKAHEYGYFYVVKEYKLFEGSVVTFGSNQLTPYLGSKSADTETYVSDLFNRLDFLTSLKEKKQFELEILQIKQIIKETYDRESSIKDALKGSLKKDAEKSSEKDATYEFLSELHKNLKNI